MVPRTVSDALPSPRIIQVFTFLDYPIDIWCINLKPRKCRCYETFIEVVAVRGEATKTTQQQQILSFPDLQFFRICFRYGLY